MFYVDEGCHTTEMSPAIVIFGGILPDLKLQFLCTCLHWLVVCWSLRRLPLIDCCDVHLFPHVPIIMCAPSSYVPCSVFMCLSSFISCLLILTMLTDDGLLWCALVPPCARYHVCPFILCALFSFYVFVFIHLLFADPYNAYWWLIAVMCSLSCVPCYPVCQLFCVPHFPVCTCSPMCPLSCVPCYPVCQLFCVPVILCVLVPHVPIIMCAHYYVCPVILCAPLSCVPVILCVLVPHVPVILCAPFIWAAAETLWTACRSSSSW